MKNKKVLLGVAVLALLGVGYFMMKKKKELGSSSSLIPVVLAKDNYPVSLANDTNGSVWIVIGGQRYAVNGTQALIDYGLDPAKYPYTVLSKEALELMPEVGSIEQKGKVVKY
jgi:hypothetical protein